MSIENYIESKPEISSVVNEVEGQKVAVLAAWPYANGPRHLGHGASLVPADTMARFHRAAGDDVLMVSGTDEYGTPNVIAAEKAGLPVETYVADANDRIRNDFMSLYMSFDWFTRTTTNEHTEVAQNLFEKLAENGYLQKGTMLGSFDQETGESLPDRYVEGGCPSCGAGSRGDQCENCNTLLDPSELINPYSSVTHNPVEFKDTEHWFLMLDKLAPSLHEWVSQHSALRPNAKASSLKQIEELRPRAITRDMQWGVALPDGYELEGDTEKVLYVWFEAVTGYLSASIEWANAQGDPDKWKEWWLNPEADHVYAMGKDNVPFHTIIWPAMLKGALAQDDAQLHLPDRIASTEYLNLGDQKFSSSRGNTLYLSDLIDVVGVDTTRFYLLNNGPETRDKAFSIEELVTVNNEELLSKWGNLVQRVLKLTVDNFDGVVPEVDDAQLPPQHQLHVEKIQSAYVDTADLLRAMRFSAATRRVLELCLETNRFLNEHEPWKTAKTDKLAAANTLYTSLTSIDNLTNLFAPFMPRSSQKVHELLGYDDTIIGAVQEHVTPEGTKIITGEYSDTKGIWGFKRIKPGQAITLGKHLFKKLDVQTVTDDLQQVAAK